MILTQSVIRDLKANHIGDRYVIRDTSGVMSNGYLTHVLTVDDISQTEDPDPLNWRLYIDGNIAGQARSIVDIAAYDDVYNDPGVWEEPE